MFTIKVVVFAALVVALAVNIVAIQRYWKVEASAEHTHHEGNPYACSLDPGWQCANTQKFHACMGNNDCLIKEGVAI